MGGMTAAHDGIAMALPAAAPPHPEGIGIGGHENGSADIPAPPPVGIAALRGAAVQAAGSPAFAVGSPALVACDGGARRGEVEWSRSAALSLRSNCGSRLCGRKMQRRK